MKARSVCGEEAMEVYAFVLNLKSCTSFRRKRNCTTVSFHSSLLGATFFSELHQGSLSAALLLAPGMASPLFFCRPCCWHATGGAGNFFPTLSILLSSVAGLSFFLCWRGWLLLFFFSVFSSFLLLFSSAGICRLMFSLFVIFRLLFNCISHF